nr:hypothetical protein [Tanacetum cinerariifolium]
MDFAYLLWEDFVYQVEHKDAKKSNEMYYPWFTKVIVNFFVTKDQSIPRRNKVNWHYARDYHMFTTIKLVSRHQNTQQYGVILPIELTNKAIRNSKSYKEYYAIPSEPPKTKESVRKKQSSSDTTVPPLTKGKRLKILAKVNKPAKEKQLAKSSTAKGLTVLFEVALTEAEHIKLATKRSLTQTHISHASGSSVDEGTSIIPGVPNVPNYESEDEEISWKSNNNKDSDRMNVEGDERANEEDDADELYRDVNINLEGRDIQMADVQTTQVIKDTHVTLTPVNPEGQQQSSLMSSRFVLNMLNPIPDTGIDFIFDSTPRVDVSVTTAAEPPLLSATTLPSPTISIMPHVQQIATPSSANVPSLSLQGLPNFVSLFRFDHRLKTLETNFLKFMQTNQFAKNVSSIHGIVDKYIDHRMNEAVKVAVRLQSDRLRDEAQAENEDFLNKLDENIQKIIKDQLEAEVLTRSSNSFKTSYVVAADLSEIELKKILIEKMENNKSIHIFDEQKNLYKALVDAYKCDKLILDTYGDTVTLKRRQDVEDNDEEPFAGSNRGSKRRQEGKEPEPTKDPMLSTQDLEEPAPQEFETGATDDQSVEEASRHPHWFQKQAKPLTPDRV